MPATLRMEAVVKKLIAPVRSIAADERGASSTEYAILVSIIGAAAVTAIGVIGNGFNSLYNALVTKMGTFIS